MQTGSMLIQRAVSEIGRPDDGIRDKALQRLREQVRPAGSLGVMEEASARLAAIAGTLDVRLRHRHIVICAGDHGICADGVTLFPADVTPKMVYAFVAGMASINVLARHADARVNVADLGVNHDFDPALPIFHKKVRKGTASLARGPAMSRLEAERCVEAGIEIVDELLRQGPVDILGTGDMGIGNTTPSAAIIAAFSGLPAADVVGRGTGVDDQGLRRKVAVVEQGLAITKPDPSDPLDVLAKVGGCEIGGIAGLVIGAARRRVPVVCDGLISGAGALIACELAPVAREYLFASHRSAEPGHAFMLQRLGLRPMLDLGFRLGEGTGAALGIELLDAATRILAEIRTFAEAAIEDVQRR